MMMPGQMQMGMAPQPGASINPYVYPASGQQPATMSTNLWQ